MVRFFFVLTLLGSAAVLPVMADPPGQRVGDNTLHPTRWDLEAARRKALLQDVTWFGHEPLSFLLRRGTNLTEDTAAEYERQHDPANIVRIAAAGVGDAGNLHFYKGLGLEAEKADRAKAAAAAGIAHQHGMKVSIYIGGSMFIESFYRETPAASQWEQRDGQNHPIPYTPLQTYRHYASMNEPAYREYLKRVLSAAVREVNPDEIFFDNTMLQPEPESDHGPQALADFRRFLQRRYPTADAAFQRFGISDAGALQAPEWDNPGTAEALTSIDDPVLQEWVRFRCETLANYCGELYDYVKGVNPRVAVGFNLKGLYSFNRLWTNAVYHPLFAGRCDFITFDTGGYNPRIDRSTGALISQIRTYRFARELGMSCVDDKLTDDISVASYMAFNLQKPIPGGKSVGGPEEMYASSVITPLFEFFRHYNNRYFTQTTAVADVAVLRTWPSLAYSVSASYVPLTLVEQVLIQHKIPFDPVCDEQLNQLSRYPVVVVAGQEAMSSEVIEKLLAYARAGGCILAEKETGALDEHRRRRTLLPFAATRNEGKGRVVVVPAVVPGRLRHAVDDGEDNPEMTRGLRRDTTRLAPPQWVLPENHQTIADNIVTELGDRLTVETGAPLTTVLEVLHRPASQETLLHFVNYQTKFSPGFFAVKVKSGLTAPVKSVRLFSPDQNDPVELPFSESAGRVSFQVPQPRVYALIVIGAN